MKSNNWENVQATMNEDGTVESRRKLMENDLNSKKW